MTTLRGEDRLPLARFAMQQRALYQTTYAEIAVLAGERLYNGEWEPTRNQIAAVLRDYDDIEARHGNGNAPATREGDEDVRRVDAPSSIPGGGQQTSMDTVEDDVTPYVYRSERRGPRLLPHYTGEPHLTGDFVVIGDVHFPTTDYALCDLMVNTARALGLRQLVIVGDLINGDAFSRYDHILRLPDFAEEIERAQQMLALWARHFDEMVMVLGNHEHRLLKYMRGQFNVDWLGQLLNALGGKLRVYVYSHVVLTSGGVVWRATHQRNYSRIKGRVGNMLAQKFHCNIITHHQHHVAKLRDDYNRYTIIDGGGLFDDRAMAYVKLVDSTSPVMSRGFVLLVDGVGHLITPYSDYTDLDVTVRGLAAKLAPREATKGVGR